MTQNKHYKSLHLALEALKGLDPEAQKTLIKNLIAKDPELAKQLQESLFEYKHIAELSRSDFKFIWFEIPRNIWLMSLRAAPPEVTRFIQANLTQRAYNELVDDLKSQGPQPVGKVMEAQKQLLDEVRSLAKQGRVILPKNLV
jgi:flagellar motor switch protein FliG